MGGSIHPTSGMESAPHREVCSPHSILHNTGEAVSWHTEKGIVLSMCTRTLVCCKGDPTVRDAMMNLEDVMLRKTRQKQGKNTVSSHLLVESTNSWIHRSRKYNGGEVGKGEGLGSRPGKAPGCHKKPSLQLIVLCCTPEIHHEQISGVHIYSMKGHRWGAAPWLACSSHFTMSRYQNLTL